MSQRTAGDFYIQGYHTSSRKTSLFSHWNFRSLQAIILLFSSICKTERSNSVFSTSSSYVMCLATEWDRYCDAVLYLLDFQYLVQRDDQETPKAALDRTGTAVSQISDGHYCFIFSITYSSSSLFYAWKWKIKNDQQSSQVTLCHFYSYTLAKPFLGIFCLKQQRIRLLLHLCLNKEQFNKDLLFSFSFYKS